MELSFSKMFLPLTPTRLLELSRAVQRNRERYEALLKRSARGALDYLALTAADARQAAVFRKELASRRERNLLPAGLRTLVVTDPAGARIGSGGATVHALRAVARDLWRTRRPRVASVAELFRSRRILIVHAGGAPAETLFAPWPVQMADGRALTLFDELFATLACMAERFGPGLLVASGDVLVVFDARIVRRAAGAVTGFAATAAAEQAVHHGVYAGGGGDVIRAFLHKMQENALRAGGALDALGRAQIDTGLVGFANRGLAAIAELAGLRYDNTRLKVRRSLLPPAFGQTLDLYDDLLPAMGANIAAEAGSPRGTLRAGRRARLGVQFGALDFQAQHLTPALFVHLGTAPEYRDAVAEDGPIRKIFQSRAAPPSDAELLLSRPSLEQEALTMSELRAAIAAEAPATVIVGRADWAAGARGVRAALDRL